MKKLITLLALGIWGHTVQAQVPAALQAKFQDTLADMQAKYGFKGLSAAVYYKNSGIWKSAVGLSGSSTPLSPDMLIGIGSNTKTFISVLMIKMQEAGLLSLDDSIGKWISGYPNINGAISIRQILNHTSGINSYTNNAATWDSVDKDLTRIWTKDEILRKFVSAPSFAPGTNWEYSNTNFIIAGLIQEKISGKSIQQLIRDSILTPQGLGKTFFPPYETASIPYAHLWSDFDGDGLLDDIGAYDSPGALPKEINSFADAAGALVSTAEDNVKFWRALMNGAIIKKSSMSSDLFRWSGFGSSSNDYGAGIFKIRMLSKIVFSHGGTWIGQINENLSDTNNNINITVLSNQDSLQNDELALVVAALYKVALDYQKLDVPELANVTGQNLMLYPNPARSQLFVSGLAKGEKTVRLYDIMGRQLKSYTTEENNLLHLSELNFPAGRYVIEVGSQETVQRAMFDIVE